MENYESNYTKGYLNNARRGEGYDKKISNKFELFIWDLEKYFLRKAHSDFLGGRKDIEYLDFACGTGRIISFFVNEVRLTDATGIDTSESMLAEARKKTSANFIGGNIVENENLLSDRKFDIITSFRLFLNIEKNNRDIILKNIVKYLKDDGYIILNNHINRHSLIGFQFWIRRLLGNKKVINSASQKEFEDMINKAGLRTKKVYKFVFFPGRKKAMMLPPNMLKKAELAISRIPILNGMCLNQIYICQKSK